MKSKTELDPKFEYPAKEINGWHFLLIAMTFFIAVVIAIALIIGCAYMLMLKFNPPPKKHGPDCGYEVISNGKGIDCNGDTILLEKNNPHGWRRKK